MSWAVRIWPGDDFAHKAAREIASRWHSEATIVLTGGTTAEKVYAALATLPLDWDGVEAFFSDERSVGPDDDESNFGMARRSLLRHVTPRAVHRMRGEDPPEQEARRYERVLSPALDKGIDLALLGLGADAHIAALFPGSPALRETDALCAAVDRPDGLRGVTLTLPALLVARHIVLIVTGAAKAGAVRRALESDEPPDTCPVRALSTHPNLTLLLDEAAARERGS